MSILSNPNTLINTANQSAARRDRKFNELSNRIIHWITEHAYYLQKKDVFAMNVRVTINLQITGEVHLPQVGIAIPIDVNRWLNDVDNYRTPSVIDNIEEYNKWLEVVNRTNAKISHSEVVEDSCFSPVTDYIRYWLSYNTSRILAYSIWSDKNIDPSKVFFQPKFRIKIDREFKKGDDTKFVSQAHSISV